MENNEGKQEKKEKKKKKPKQERSAYPQCMKCKREFTSWKYVKEHQEWCDPE